MVCSKSKYNKNGDLIYRITAGEKVFPEVLEVEFNDKGNLLSQSLYDKVVNNDGKEFKKLKMRTEVVYDKDGKVSKITAPDAIKQYSYNTESIEIPMLNTVLESSSVSRIENLLKDENGNDKPDTVCYVIESEGTYNEGMLNIDYTSIRVLKSYQKGTITLIGTEYHLFKDNNIVYYENRDPNDTVLWKTTWEYNEEDKPVYITTEDFRNMQTSVSKYDYYDYYDFEVDEEKGYGDRFEIEYFTSSRRIISMETDEEIYVEESSVDFKKQMKDDKEYIIQTVTVSEYDTDTNESTQYIAAEYTYDEYDRVVKEVDNTENTITINFYDDRDSNYSRRIIKHIDTKKKITPFDRNKGPVAKNEEIELYIYEIFEDKNIEVIFSKYPNGYIRKSTRISDMNDNELCAVITDNGQDASVGVLFDTLYDKN